MEEVLAAIADLKQFLDTRLGAIADAIDDLRLSHNAHVQNSEALITNVDSAIRGVVNNVADAVATVYGAASDMEDMLELIDSRITTASSALATSQITQATIMTKIDSTKALVRALIDYFPPPEQ